MIESFLLAPGNILSNRYEIVRELGRGGFGRSYLAIDLNKFGEKCVLKEFAPQLQTELTKAKELFEREAETLYKLKHPQIPAFRELLRVNAGGTESLLLVQDYIEGETYLARLNDRLKQQQPFSEAEVVQFCQDLLPVLDYIHRIGVIHRDISPDNLIYCDRDKLPVLIDFGSVKEIAVTLVSRYSNAKIATRIGKQGYAPDEQMLRGKVSPASDLYAVGATALTLLTGRDASTLYSPAEARWEWRKFIQLSPEFGVIIDRLLQHNPQDRYQSAAEVLAVLDAVNINYTAHVTPAPKLATNSIPIVRNNQISQLKTIEISPRSKVPAASQATEVARDPNEWKKPAWQVTKVMTVTLFTCVAISSAVKWVQAIDPIGMATRQFNNTTAGIVNSIPNPLRSSQPSVQQRQQDLNQQLKQLNIPAAKFYRQVDRAFYAKHPELNGRSLTAKAEDDKLRQEWQDLAVEMLAKTSR
jgi:serine/threonine protein kinase, bacterial